MRDRKAEDRESKTEIERAKHQNLKSFHILFICSLFEMHRNINGKSSFIHPKHTVDISSQQCLK